MPREEEFYEREAVLGRDATSVFPKEAAAAEQSNRDAMVEALGARKFISESEVRMKGVGAGMGGWGAGEGARGGAAHPQQP
jgi:hypothetical protein